MEDCLPHRTIVARGPVCQVEQCACGILHVTIGVLTLRLEADVVASLCSTLTDAVARVCPRDAHPAESPREALPS